MRLDSEPTSPPAAVLKAECLVASWQHNLSIISRISLLPTNIFTTSLREHKKLLESGLLDLYHGSSTPHTEPPRAASQAGLFYNHLRSPSNSVAMHPEAAQDEQKWFISNFQTSS